MLTSVTHVPKSVLLFRTCYNSDHLVCSKCPTHHGLSINCGSSPKEESVTYNFLTYRFQVLIRDSAPHTRWEMMLWNLWMGFDTLWNHVTADVDYRWFVFVNRGFECGGHAKWQLRGSRLVEMNKKQEHVQVRSLPPVIDGEVNGYLTMKVDEIVWHREPCVNAVVLVRWWGENEPSVFRWALLGDCHILDPTTCHWLSL
jgi:hypothetical protein